MFWQNFWKIVFMFQLKVTKRFFAYCCLFFSRPSQIQFSKVKRSCVQSSYSSPPPKKSGFECYCSNRLYLFCFFQKQNQFFCFFLHVDNWYLRKRTVIATKWFLLQMFLLRCFLEKVEMPQHHYQLNDLLLDSYGCVVSVSWVSKTMSLRWEGSNNDEPTISRD